MLNKVQFLTYASTGKEDKTEKEARSIAKNILMQSRFVKEMYSKMSENDLFNELSLQTRREVNKAIVLYYYGDYDNAYTEFDKVFKKTQVTYPLYYFAEKIFISSENTKRLMQISANIRKIILDIHIQIIQIYYQMSLEEKFILDILMSM